VNWDDYIVGLKPQEIIIIRLCIHLKGDGCIGATYRFSMLTMHRVYTHGVVGVSPNSKLKAHYDLLKQIT